MCQTLAQGGKRCDTHKDGSKATVSLTSRIADVQEKIVRKVFGSLKKEGKGLESPDKEEVISYAETGKFLTKYNPDIPERQKKTIMNQFDKAKEEEPSGPLFHAWKHTLPEVLRRTRKSMSAVGIAGVILATSACGGGQSGVTVTPAPSESPSVSVSAAPSASPSATPSVSAGSKINGIPTLTEVANDGKGEYIKTTISDDDPAMKYNPAIVQGSASQLYSPDEIVDGQRFVSKFVAEEVIDSTLNNNPSDPANISNWISKNGDKFDPAQKDALFRELKTPGSNVQPLMKGEYREKRGNYVLASGPNQTHVLSRQITPTTIAGASMNGQSYLGVHIDAKYELNAVVDGKPYREPTTASIDFTIKKDAATGKWLIAGLQNTYTTDYAK